MAASQMLCLQRIDCKSAPDIAEPVLQRQAALRRGVANAQQHACVQPREAAALRAQVLRQQPRLVESAGLESCPRQRQGKNHIVWRQASQAGRDSGMLKHQSGKFCSPACLGRELVLRDKARPRKCIGHRHMRGVDRRRPFLAREATQWQ